MEVIADQEIQKFMKQQDLGSVEIDIEQFAEEYLHLRFDYAELSNNGSILGMTIFQDCFVPFFDSASNTVKHHSVKAGTALIDQSLIDEPGSQRRVRFTIAHECAHWILHRPAQVAGERPSLQDEAQPSNDLDNRIICRKSTSTQKPDSSPKTAAEWKEWQADNLASALLMPAASVRAFINDYLDRENQKDNILAICHGERMVLAKNNSMVRQMAAIFNVSEQAAEIRLKKLGFLTDTVPGLYQPIVIEKSEIFPLSDFDDWF